MKNNKKRDWFRSITGITLSIAVIFLSWAAVSWASLTNFMEVKHIKILNHHFISENDYRLIVEKFVNNESYQWVAEQLNYYARRNVTFATHVHIAVQDEDCAIHVANSLRQWIAPLLAISTNSPFFEGELTGIRSSRTFQFGVFPRTNIPVRFNDFNEYQTLVNKYLETDTIKKPRQIWWKIRTEYWGCR